MRLDAEAFADARRTLRARMGIVAAVAMLLAVPLGTVDSQWATPNGWHRLSVGVGPAVARSPLTPTDRRGIAAMAAFELVAREHLEVRFSGTLFEGTGGVVTQLGGVAIDAVVFPWRGRLQPYVGGGVGVYQLTVDDTDPAATDTTLDHKGFAWTALAGTRLRLGWVTPFIEWRGTTFASGAPVHQYAPLIAGLHF